MTKYILTTIAWVESIAKKEIERVWWKDIVVYDRMIEFEWDSSTMIKVNLWSRVWNKVWQVLWVSEKIDDFDKLYDLFWKINFKKYFHHNYPIIIKAKTIKSKLESEPAIQKISKKAIIDNLTDKSWAKVIEDEKLEKFEIMVLIIENKARILLNTSWNALHKREYRAEAWEAPIKESLAAAIVLLSDFRFKNPFYDIFCWSWTIAIEAAMIAKNIAPWLNRYFAFEKLLLADKTLVEKEIAEAKSKIFEGNYQIFASDIDESILEIAKANAKLARVDDIIKFSKADFRDYLNKDLSGTLVSNPPYWVRLKDNDIDSLYKDINKIFEKNSDLNGWIISSYFDFDMIIKQSDYKKRKLYNGWEKTYFYKKK